LLLSLLFIFKKQDYEREDTDRGADSALYIFFTRKIMTVAYQAIKDVSDVFDVPENNQVTVPVC
jgi:hypothetical protein